MNDADPAVLARIINALGEIGGTGAVAAAIAALGSADAALRVDAVITISGMTYRTKVGTMASAVEPLIQVGLGDPDRGARKYAASTLAKLRDARAIEPLIKMVEDKDREVQDAAAQALSELTGQRFGRNARCWREWLAKRPR